MRYYVDMFVKSAPPSLMASEVETIVLDGSEQDEYNENCGEEQEITLNARRKLWMKTPFASFSSDSSVCSAGLRNSEAIQSLRLKLQEHKVKEDDKIGDTENDKKPVRGVLNRLRFYDTSFKLHHNKQRSLEGPLRVIRLCVLSIVFPGMLVGVPLYMRYYVYGEQVYPVGMSDMRLLDHRVSTTWCQGQTVWSNATFNAYLMEAAPQMEKEHEIVSMTRDLNNLEDDMKEYWGFYLLKGSVITVSACARYPGASLILIKGHKHLRDCAYIGDDSSEELDELYPDDKNNTEVHQDPPNKPAQMTKMSDGIVIHGQLNTINATDGLHPYSKKLSESLSDSMGKNDRPKKVIRNGLKVGHQVHLAYAELGNKLAKIHADMERLKSNYSDIGRPNNKNNKKPIMQVNQPHEETVSTQKPPVLSSRELYEDVLKRLQSLGDTGKRVLQRLNQSLINETRVFNITTDGVKKTTSTSEKPVSLKHKIRHNKKLLKHNKNHNVTVAGSTTITTTNTTVAPNGDVLNRDRREILLNSLHNPIMEQEEDTAMEEDLHTPDDIADIRGSVNETTAYDKSNSEFWSSFSSSEERLLNCEGLLLNLPLVSHSKCNVNLEDHHHNDAFGPNSVTYKVSSNGYYFFVFNSENEVKPNFLRIHFRLEKTIYNVSDPVASCRNQTAPCSLPLTFWSQQKVVLQLPVRPNDALWNQEFLAISTCEPRTSIYVICVIAVPLFIILFAFQ